MTSNSHPVAARTPAHDSQSGLAIVRSASAVATNTWRMLLTAATLCVAGLLSAPALAQGQFQAQNADRIDMPIEIASREQRACDLPPQFVPRSLWNANLWPSGTVPYEWDANVTAGNQALMLQSMAAIEAVANIHFVVRVAQPNYLHIQSGSGNNSYVGTIGGAQTVNIFNWNYKFIMCHELIHALGVWHEQSRADRGTYVTVNYANIQTAYAGNYNIVSSAAAVGPFDFDSVMLYDACSFSTCCAAGFTCSCATSCAAMQTLPAYAAFQSGMGQRTHLSTGDIAGLVSRYGLPCASCHPDINCSGTVNVQDIFDFLAAWFAGSPVGDYNGLNGNTIADIFAFLSAWFAGC